MNKEEILKYNLTKISAIDKEIKENNNNKNSMYEHNMKRLNIYNILLKFTNKYIQILMILLTSIIVYIILQNGIYTSLLSMIIVIIYNSILLISLNTLKPKDSYNKKIDEYNKQNTELYIKRNTYINLYNYTLNKDKAIIDNIKLRINKKKYYEYDKYIDKYSNQKDSYEFITLNQMKNDEDSLIECIKNKIYWELNPSFKTEELTNEQLKLIADAIINI